jgi:sortase A
MMAHPVQPESPAPRRSVRRSARAALACATLVTLIAGVFLVGRHLYLQAKGMVATALIDRAWVRSLDDGRAHRPWPWADFTPVARLELRRLAIDRPILSDATGRTLAFGLGHLVGSAPLGGPGTGAIGGHRDTWAAFLARVEPGDTLVLRTRAGGRRYRVVAREVVDQRDVALPARTGDGSDPAIGDRLVFVTCWPFDSFRRGPLRYVVTAVAQERPAGIVATVSDLLKLSAPRPEAR